jgi:hypothetical protein
MSTTSWSLNNSIHETMDHYLSIQHHGLFSLIPYMRPGTTLSVYTTSWSLINHFIYETRDHSICLYNTMVSYQQFHTWDHGPLYLSIKHHDLFSLIPYMRPGTTLSVYTTSWSLSTLSTHKTMDHSVCLYITMVSSHQFSAWDHHGLFSSVSCTRPVSIICVYYTIVSSHQFPIWDHGPLYLSIQHHGLFSPTLFMRPWTTLSVYTTSWSLLTNHIHETRDHSVCLYNTMVSSHQSHTWDQWPLYLSIQHHGLFSPIPYMRTGTTLSVYTTPWSLLTNSMHETRNHSISLYNIMVSSHQLYAWDQEPLYLSIQHHGLFSPIKCMRPGTTLSVYTTPWSLLTNPIHETRDHSISLYNIMVSFHLVHT